MTTPTSRGVSRRRLLQSGAALGVLGAPAVHAQAGPKIRIGYWPIAAGLPFYAAIELGYFKEAGLDVEPLRFAGAQQVMEAVLAGRADGTSNGTGSANIGLSAPLGGVEATQRIVGRIENVTRDGATGRTLVKLGVGTNNGVAANMLFRVVRGNEWVANVVIVQADLGFSIGEVNLTSKSGAVQVGDEARTKLQ